MDPSTSIDTPLYSIRSDACDVLKSTELIQLSGFRENVVLTPNLQQPHLVSIPSPEALIKGCGNESEVVQREPVSGMAQGTQCRWIRRREDPKKDMI